MAKGQIDDLEKNNGKTKTNETHYLEEENAYLKKTVVALKEEISSLKETVNILQKERLEYAAQYNRLQNIVTNIDSTLRTIPSKLLDLTDSTSSVLQLVRIASTLHMIENSNLTSCSMVQEKISAATSSMNENKAHIVKPHMVNGHILQEPTITLTRLNDSYLAQERISERDENSVDTSRPSTSQNINNNNSNNGNNNNNAGSSEHLENEEFNQSSRNSNERRLYTIPELPESPFHPQSPESSTVLSGTFQEVNIYQISDNRLDAILNGANEQLTTAGLRLDQNIVRSEFFRREFLPTVQLTRLKRKSSLTKQPSGSLKRNKKNDEEPVPGTSKSEGNLIKEKLNIENAGKKNIVRNKTENDSHPSTIRRSSRIKKRLFS